MGLVPCMVKFSKTDPGTLPHLRWSSFQQLVTEESCKGLHLICDKILGSPPDFYVSHHMRSFNTQCKYEEQANL